MLLYLLSALTYLLGIVLIVVVVMQRKEPSSTLAWVLIILLVPLFGALLYLWFGYARVERRVRRKRKSNEVIAAQLTRIEQKLVDYKIVPEHSFTETVQADLVKVTEASAPSP